ncbi:MAG: serine hydrolase domain-containing protein [Pseudomonadota bacterium]
MDTHPDLAGFSATRLARIREHLQHNYLEAEKISGAQVTVARHGHVAYFESMGRMDLERNRSVAEDTIFRIYSMTKPITSVALMQLYERGMFQLNDPVYRLLPAWRDQQVYVGGDADDLQLAAPENPVTFKHLLMHMAGLSYGATKHPVDQQYRRQEVVRTGGVDLQSFVERMAKVPLHFDPGSRWMYSYATDVCGYLVEALSGQSLDAYFKEHIFDPLGMTDTGFWVPEGARDRLAANYQRGADKRLELLDDPVTSSYLTRPAFLSGGGGLVSTSSDYLKFCEMLRQAGSYNGERIIGPRTLKLMHENHLPGGGDLAGIAAGGFSETAYEGVGFGLGFAMTLSQTQSATIGYDDYYWGGAASTIFWVDPVEDLVVIFMTQLMPSTLFNFRGQLKNIIYGAIEA